MVKMTPEEARGILSAHAAWQKETDGPRHEYMTLQEVPGYPGMMTVKIPEYPAREHYDQFVMDFMREWVRSVAERSANPHRHEITQIVTGSPPYPIS